MIFPLVIEQVADLTGHTSRVLLLAVSPDNSTVASVAADETIRSNLLIKITELHESFSNLCSKKNSVFACILHSL